MAPAWPEGALDPGTMIDGDEVDRFLVAAFLGACPAWPDAWEDSALQDRVRDQIGIQGIAYALAVQPDGLAGWPARVVEPVREEARLQAFWELSHRTEIAAVVAALGEAGVTAVLLKGTALAYTVYADPALRRRGDTDLLVHECDLSTAREVLRSQGFAGETTFGMQAQEQWTAGGQHGFAHTVDLHWKVIDAIPLQHVLTVEEMFENAIPAPRLAPGALASDPVRQVLHCALNQAWHRHKGFLVEGERVFPRSRIIWARDIDLLCRGFDTSDWARLTALAISRGVATACLEALLRAADLFGCPVPKDTVANLREARGGGLADRYLRSNGRFTDFWLSLAGARGPAAKARYLLCNLFPPREHMAQNYRIDGTGRLAMAHFTRLGRMPLRLVRGD